MTFKKSILGIKKMEAVKKFNVELEHFIGSKWCKYLSDRFHLYRILILQ